MPQKNKEQEKRAAQLRDRIKKMKSSANVDEVDKAPQRADESPKEYVQRLEKNMEIDKGKK